MGGGSAIKQSERRSHQGESVQGEYSNKVMNCQKGGLKDILILGKYEVRKTGDGYELLKSSEPIGWFSVAVVEDDRVLFPLSKGIQLEVSERGCREILISEKAELCGLIASDGGIYSTKSHPDHEVHFCSIDRVLVERYNELFRTVYGINPYLHHKKKSTGESYFESRTYHKGVYFDLLDLDIKPGAYKFRVPLKHLDKGGLRAYLRGFFSGDGNITKDVTQQYKIGLQSTCKEGLEGLREAFKLLGFHPLEIFQEKQWNTKWRDRYHFSISAYEHMRFVKEIGTDQPNRMKRMEEIERQLKRRSYKK